LLALKAGVTYIGPEQILRDMLADGQFAEKEIDRMLYAVLYPDCGCARANIHSSGSLEPRRSK
jgi:hypothetical protein